MTTKIKKAAGKKTAKSAKKPTAAKTGTKNAKPAPAKTTVDITPLPDPCADGHKWGKDGDGVEHCIVCLADRKVIEKGAKKRVAKAASAKPVRAAKAEGKLSALDAAAQVLAKSAEPLNAKQMVEAMAAKGLWTSPGGKTPWATLYSALIREITVKGNASRFKKTERGHFTVNG